MKNGAPVGLCSCVYTRDPWVQWIGDRAHHGSDVLQDGVLWAGVAPLHSAVAVRSVVDHPCGKGMAGTGGGRPALPIHHFVVGRPSILLNKRYTYHIACLLFGTVRRLTLSYTCFLPSLYSDRKNEKRSSTAVPASFFLVWRHWSEGHNYCKYLPISYGHQSFSRTCWFDGRKHSCAGLTVFVRPHSSLHQDGPVRRRRLGQSSFELHRVQTCALLCSRFECFNSYPQQNPKTLIYGEATCNFPDEGSMSSIRMLIHTNTIPISTASRLQIYHISYLSFRLDSLLPSSGKLQGASP